ncbi:MAG: hypothetical protein PHS44_04025 [Candidatus Dojkabacteria bacterium]|jgi:hypothetical protein|nr:hypothetical protein [Candidatus Dojkabacteria bacterium]
MNQETGVNVVHTATGETARLDMTAQEYGDLQTAWNQATARIGEGPGFMNRLRALGTVVRGVFRGEGVGNAIQNLRYVRAGEVVNEQVDNAERTIAVVETSRSLTALIRTPLGVVLVQIEETFRQVMGSSAMELVPVTY